jgi:cobalamin biosynthesis protein CobD
MAAGLIESLGPFAPNPYILGFGVALDLAIGDPTYAWHPIRILGRASTATEARLRAAGLNGYVGGVLLFVWLALVAVGATCLGIVVAARASSTLAWLIHAFIVYSLLALGALLRQVWMIERALRAGNLLQARSAVSELVGRDTDQMDAGACRRAAVESLSENLTDGFVSPVFWYALVGIPGVVLFKIVSTMDSMVGYKTERYLRFGWCGARLDDLMNYEGVSLYPRGDLRPPRYRHSCLRGLARSPDPSPFSFPIALEQSSSYPVRREPLPKHDGTRCRESEPGHDCPARSRGRRPRSRMR